MAGGTRIKEDGFNFQDPITGETILVYEPESNDDNKNPERAAELIYYISPLCSFSIPQNGDEPIPVDDHFRYTFNMRCFPARVYSFIAEKITQRLSGQIGDKQIASAKISSLPLQSVTFRTTFPGVTFYPLIDNVDKAALGEMEPVVVNVEKKRNEIFQQQLNTNTGITLTVDLVYNVLDTTSAELNWSIQDVQDTKAFKDLVQGGSNFVRASQVQNIVMEAATRANTKIVAFPGMREKLESALNGILKRIFDDFFNSVAEQTISSRDEAEQLDRKIIAGTGLDPNDFKPIVTFFDIVEKLKDVVEVNKANEILKKFATDNSTSTDFSFDYIGEGFASFFDFGDDSKSNTERQFKNSEAFRSFREKLTEKKGQEVVVVLRGIKLLEKGQFTNNISKAASFVVVEVKEAKLSVGATTVLKKGSDKEIETRELDILNIINRANPVGIIFTFGGVNIPEGFLFCDGKEYDRITYKSLFDAIGTKWGDALPTHFRVPDLRREFLRGTQNIEDVAYRQEYATGLPQNDFIVTAANSSHSHDIPTSTATATGGDYPMVAVAKGQTSNQTLSLSNGGGHTHGFAGGDDETRPRNRFVNFIIRFK